MRLTTLDEASIQAIGHAFGYYDYGKETGMGAACSSPDKTARYICGFVRAMLAAGLLYTTSERGEAFIAYRLPGERVKLTAFLPLLKGVFQAMTFRELCRFARLMKRAGASLNDRYDKEKKPHIYVGLVCVTEKYQGQGYMRKVLEMAFADGNRLQVPVILETDAKSKCDKYVHLGMELAHAMRANSAHSTTSSNIRINKIRRRHGLKTARLRRFSYDTVNVTLPAK